MLLLEPFPTVQWGAYKGYGLGRINFPISFSTECTAAIVQPVGWNGHSVDVRTVSYIEGDFKANDANKVGTWIAVGY